MGHTMTEPAYLNRELGLIEAERINRLLGLRFKYLISIPIAAVPAYLAGLAGAPDMVAILVFLAGQVIYGYLLARWENRRAR